MVDITEVIMTRRTKQYDDEVVEEFYGINSSMFEVERVRLTRKSDFWRNPITAPSPAR
jgi:hypothetical protein